MLDQYVTLLNDVEGELSQALARFETSAGDLADEIADGNQARRPHPMVVVLANQAMQSMASARANLLMATAMLEEVP